MATVTDSNTASATSVTIQRRETPDKDRVARCSTTLDIRCNSEGEIPLALPLPEVKPRFPLPLPLMHFHSGLLMYFRSGVDTQVTCSPHGRVNSSQRRDLTTRNLADTDSAYAASP